MKIEVEVGKLKKRSRKKKRRMSGDQIEDDLSISSETKNFNSLGSSILT